MQYAYGRLLIIVLGPTLTRIPVARKFECDLRPANVQTHPPTHPPLPFPTREGTLRGTPESRLAGDPSLAVPPLGVDSWERSRPMAEVEGRG